MRDAHISSLKQRFIFGEAVVNRVQMSCAIFYF